MEFIKLRLINSRYNYEDVSNIKMCILSRFLETDATIFMNSIKNWLDDIKLNALFANITNLYKETNKIILSDQYSKEEDGGPFLEIPKKEFIKILDEWEKICKEKPKEVMIIKEDDTYRFETKNEEQILNL